jgi:hypothetical protein
VYLYVFEVMDACAFYMYICRSGDGHVKNGREE